MSTPALVLGGTGYVAGELLRLIAGHPELELAAAISDSQPGERIAKSFGHLAATYPQTTFASIGTASMILTETKRAALFSAAPHGAAAALIDRLLTSAAAAKCELRVVDISADFRYANADAYQAIYGHPHGAPVRLKEFSCALPEHLPKLKTPHVAHPGCLATAALLASVPLLALDIAEPQIFVSAVTGSTGSGRKPTDGTHHPARHSDFYAYNVLKHRHAPEIKACAKAASGVDAEFMFVPHSGPFARGIHATVQARTKRPITTEAALAMLRDYYMDQPFVRVLDQPPRMKDIVASNYAHLSAVANGQSIVVMSVVDNLNKGAAGGAVQWMNRMLGFEETAGLKAPAAGWT
ncbi:MAG: N-acetyl-gamma-glutamyl-phosphate reductase [Steroidobacteraceae bacterium]